MNRQSLLLFLALVICSLGATAQITSTFDTDADGWTMAHTGGTAGTFSFQSIGGNSGGFISAAPPTAGGSVNIGFGWYWNAPVKFFGDFDFSYGANFKVDLQQSVAGTDNTQSDIIIYSGGNTLHFNFPTKPAVSPAWSIYSIALDETAGWRWGSVAGALALKPQIKIVLANITGIRIRCKYVNSTGYTSGIDNVAIEKRTLVASPTISSFAPTSTYPDETVTITGSNFGTNPATNIVYFGLVKAEVLTATASQLTVKVPKAAALAPISVINTSTGLTAVSALDFLPLTVTDPDFIGHLLPGSFSTNVIVPYGDFNDNGLAGGAMGDIDGDGLLDIVAFEDPGEFAIFLNKGQSGPLTSTSFSSKIQIPSGELGQGNSNGTILHDFDNDGKIDIATFFRGVNPALPGGFAVSRNISTPGTILFEPAEQFYNVGIFCSGLDADDLDGDGLLDFLINSSGLYYARNISTPGNIEFATLRFLNASGGAVSTKDLNGDNKPDIMVVSSASFNLLENISTPGNIQFATPVNFPGSVVSGITLADLDSDNKSDILYYRINGFNDYNLVVKKNIHTTGPLSTASFDTDVILSSVNRAYSQRVADLNGDGKPDILMGLNSGSTGYGFGVFESNVQPGTLNTSSFLPLIEYEETSNGVFAIPLIGDLNGDLLPDVVGFASSDGGEHGLILYTNQTTSAPNISVNTVSPLAAPVGSTVTITGNKFSTDITKNTVWFGGVKAQVITATKNEITVTVPPGASYERVSVTRDNRTSRYHLPFSTTFSSGVTFDGTSFAAPVSFPVTGADYDVEAADLNGDGKPELVAESRVVTGIIRNYAWSFENVNTTGFISSSSFIISDTTNESALNLRMVDLDEDGRLDILSQQALFRNSTSTNEIEFDNNVNGAGGSNQNWADFDLDGKTDVIAANTGGASMLLYRNTSKPGPFRIGAFATFGAALGLSKPAANGGTAVGDFDNDGFVEFASTNPTSDNMSVWRNTGGFPLSAAQFSVVGNLPTGDNPGRLYVGDFDRDGKLDLVLYHGTGTNNTLLIVFRNTSTVGNISFTRIDLTNPSATTVATVADLDGDGKPEIVTTSESGNRFSIFKNLHTTGALTAASFATPFNTTVTAPRGITTGDLNLDGKPEIILTRAAGLLLVYENLVSVTQNFITQWNLATAGSSPTQLTLGTATSGTVNYAWQEISPGTASGGGSWSGATLTIPGLPTNATIRLQISPANFQRIIINNGADRNRLTQVEQWGSTAWTSMESAFLGCTNLQVTATDVPNLSAATNMRLMFSFCTNLNSPSNINTWNTSNVSNMVETFSGARAFNQDIGAWNTAAVTNMQGMFFQTDVFNQNIGTWNTAAVTDMSNMFGLTDAFNQNIGTWNTAAVTRMVGMFRDAIAFNQDIGAWNTAAVTTMLDMFQGAVVFNQNIGLWNTAAVTNMEDMFNGAGAFNQNIGAWNTGAVIDMERMFLNASTFNQNISSWNTSTVIDMRNMFANATVFNQNIGAWTLNPAVTMTNMFDNTGMDCNNYSATLIGWSANSSTPNGRSLGATGRQYGTNAVAARTNLTSSKGWTITGDTPSGTDCGSVSAPTITNFTPTSGPIGTTVTVTGTNFSATPANNTVAFNGTTATVTASTATSITTTVPAGATTGAITVTVAGNTATSATNFTVTDPLPTIISFTPTSGPIGTTVTVTGTNFSATPANNTFAFNGTTAVVAASTTTSLTTTVPTGATTGKITVTVAGNMAMSGNDFTVTAVTNNQPPVITPTASAAPIAGIVIIDLLPLLSDPDNNLDLSTLSLTTPTSEQGATATLLSATTQLELNYGSILFAGTDRVTISVCDLLSACTDQELTIEVTGEITIYNAVSPNNDGKNDFFNILNIEALEPDNSVTIYNRWGSKVYEVENYTEANAFRGLNQNGNELPSGTYYYKIAFKSSGKIRNGYLVLKR